MPAFYGKASDIASNLIEAFKAGNIPAAISQVFINKADVPCNKWSWNNRIITALGGTQDARGYNQWLDVGRQVKKGSKAIHILAPLTKKRKDTNGEDFYIVTGFRSVPVFRYEDTEGDELEGYEEADSFLEKLPLKEVADHWEVELQTFNGTSTAYHGFFSYSPNKTAIALGVENLSTWVHELMHCADYRLGNLNPTRGQQWDNEMVAEFGGATILTMLGYETDADWGGCWDYVVSYADGDKDQAIQRLMKIFDRMCKAIDLIMTTAEELNVVSQ